MSSPLPSPKSIILAIGIEAHDFAHARKQLDEIAHRLIEAEHLGHTKLDVVSSGGWHLVGDVDPERSADSYDTELMAWFDRRRAAR